MLSDDVADLEDRCAALELQVALLESDLDACCDLDDLLDKMKLYGVWTEDIAIFIDDYKRYFSKARKSTQSKV